jgi:glycosyltransferase involved in cell wall biosynthesis
MSGQSTAPGISVGHLAVLVSYSGDGGVERMMNALIAGLLEVGYAVDVLVLQRRGGHVAEIPSGARVIPVWPRHAVLAAPALARYLRRERPSVLLAAKDRAGRAALRARASAGVNTRVVLRIGNTLSESLAGRGWLRTKLRYWPIRRWYPHADAIVAVSRGVAEDVVTTSGVNPDRVHVVHNPVVSAAIERLAEQRPDHSWLNGGGVPVVLGVGRLTRQKDFPTLFRAFAQLRARRDARLVILGEGEERAPLEALARELRIERDIDMPGFVDNPYAWMRCASLFVLSSAWEGSPNALTEALYLGTPVVATDCRSGPREILDDGRVGALVAVGDVSALAEAMLATIEEPPAGVDLQRAALDYTVERSTAHYLDVLLPDRDAEARAASH